MRLNNSIVSEFRSNVINFIYPHHYQYLHLHRLLRFCQYLSQSAKIKLFQKLPPVVRVDGRSIKVKSVVSYS